MFNPTRYIGERELILNCEKTIDDVLTTGTRKAVMCRLGNFIRKRAK